METINKLKELMHMCMDKGLNFNIGIDSSSVYVFKGAFSEYAYFDGFMPLTHSVDGLIQKVRDYKTPSEDEIKQAKIEALRKELNELTN